MNRKAVISAAIGAIALAGCSAHDYGPKQSFGGLAGAGLGALAGSQIGKGRGQLAAVGAGALIGAVLGSSLGRSLDRADRNHASQAEYQALEHAPSGSQITWNNPDSGNYGTVTPQATYQAPSGAYCREYQHTIHVGGQPQQGYGTACRQPDGSWRVQD